MRIVRIVCLVTFVLALIVTIAFFSWWLIKDRIVFGNQKFDQVGWITAVSSADNSCHRGDMAYDLQQRVLQPGMSRQAAMALLGRPTWEDPGQIEYDLGSCMHVIHGIRLYFNAQDALTHSRIVQH